MSLLIDTDAIALHEAKMMGLTPLSEERIPDRGFSSVKSSGAMQEFGTGAVRDTPEGKGRFDLLPGYALWRLARHFENGAKKYSANNWRKGIPLARYLDSAGRHLEKLKAGWRDEDHAAAAAWNILCFLETEKAIKEGLLPKDLDDLSEGQALIPKDWSV